MSEKSLLEAPDPLGLFIDPANIRHDSNYKLIDGEVLSLAELSAEDIRVATVADILGITRAAVYQMLKSDRLKSTKYGRTPLIKKDDLERFRAHWSGRCQIIIIT